MRVHDENNVPRLLAALEALSTKKIQIGIFSEDDSEILMIANVHEYGVSIGVTDKMRKYLHAIGIHLSANTSKINIPERSFVRAGFDANKSKIEEKGKTLLERVIMLELHVDTFFEVMGEYIVGLIQEFLTDLDSPANSPVTIQQKVSSNPLIDTGRLRQAITYKVVG